MRDDCYLIFIEGAGQAGHEVVKIGHSNNPAKRFMQLSHMGWIAPTHMEATGKNAQVPGVEIEKFLHDRLNKHRVHGEWFHVPRGELLDAKDAVWKSFGTVFMLIEVGDWDEPPPVPEALQQLLMFRPPGGVPFQ